MIGDRWGVTEAEIARRYPCDDIVTEPVLQVWRGVSVQAPADTLWRWVGQVRLAPYSYDWIDNLGRTSPQQLRDLADPVVGEPFTAVGGHRTGRILAVEPNVHLTARIIGAVMSYLIVPDENGCRLLMKIVTARGRWLAPALSLGDLVMARRQLLNLKRLAEGS
jgi:hypothetical protein